MQQSSVQSAERSRASSDPQPDTAIWLRAIASRESVNATYNAVVTKLAPHNLYTRGDRFYVAAVAIERRGTPVTERKVGIFALAGLRDCALTHEGFDIDASYDPADERFAATSIFAVEPAPDKPPLARLGR